MNTDMRNINWNDVQDFKQSVKQAGEFVFKISDIDKKVNRNGDDMYVLECDTKDAGGLNVYLTVNEKMLWKIKKFVTIVDKSLLNNSDPEVVIMGTKGKKFVGVVTKSQPRLNPQTQQYEENDYYEISDFKRLPTE